MKVYLFYFSPLWVTSIINAAFIKREGFGFDQPIVISLKTRSNLNKNVRRDLQLDDMKTIQKRLESKYTIPENSETSLTLHMNLCGFVGSTDHQYYFDLEIGTPKQLLEVSFDTGLSDIYINTICGENGNCNKKLPYNPETSSTKIRKNISFTSNWGNGNITGEMISDTFTIGDRIFKDQLFGKVNEISNLSNFPRDSLIDGVFGLGFKSNSNFSISPFIENLKTSGIFKAGTIGIYIPTVFDIKQAWKAELILGGYNKKLGENSNYFPLTSKYWWQIAIDSITIGEKNPIKIKGSHGIIDTQTAAIIAPIDLANQFYKNIPGSFSLPNNPAFHLFPCNSTISVNFTFNGINYPLYWDSLILDYVNPLTQDLCIGSVVGMKSDRWILGSKFLRSVYTILDVTNRQIGFSSIKESN